MVRSRAAPTWVGLIGICEIRQECLEEYFALVSEGERLILYLIPFRYPSLDFSERCFEGKSLY